MSVKDGLDNLSALQARKLAGIRDLSYPVVFFDQVRTITGPLTQLQVDGIKLIMKYGEKWAISWLAYALATAWHESRFKPIEEIGKGRGRPYSKPGKYGQSQHGRGYVQLTWDFNYEWADRECTKAGLIKAGEILANFNLVMEPRIAAFILTHGMETGAFTSKSLGDYLNSDVGTFNQFKASRRIVNGADKDAMIAEYAMSFQSAINKGMFV